MENIKLKEVKNSFIYSQGYKYLFGLCFYYQFGIHQRGVWIGEFRRNNSYQLGFLQWQWIKKILVSMENRSVYFIFYDVNSVFKTIATAVARPFLKMRYLVTADDGEQAIKVPSVIDWDDIGVQEYFDIEIFVNIIKENNFAEIEII
jgi:hypothetical protein